MVAGYHLIWTVYGFWLPNDVRGSTSKGIRIATIKELGALHYGRKPRQPSIQEIRAQQAQAQEILKHPVYTLDGEAIALVARSFAAEIASRGYFCHACAIMPDHVHLLLRRHRDYAEVMIDQLQESSRATLTKGGKRVGTHPVWTKGGWKGFLNSQDDFEHTIEYIRANPLEIGWPVQEWDFVRDYDGWLP